MTDASPIRQALILALWDIREKHKASTVEDALWKDKTTLTRLLDAVGQCHAEPVSLAKCARAVEECEQRYARHIWPPAEALAKAALDAAGVAHVD
jgi:hypothetical protein